MNCTFKPLLSYITGFMNAGQSLYSVTDDIHVIGNYMGTLIVIKQYWFWFDIARIEDICGT